MIPTRWQHVRRPSDDELVGYLVSEDARDDVVVPTSLVGLPLGPARSVSAAVELLVASGLAHLARHWWSRLPAPLPRGVLPAASPEPDWGWRPVVVVEASPTSCHVRPEWPAPEEMSARAVLPVPVGGLLRPEPPE